MNCPAPSLRPHYRALTATTSRSAPVPRIGTLALAVSAACGSPPRGQLPRPSLSGRQVLLFHASACDELTPPIHRAPPGPHTANSPTEGPPQRAFVPGPPTDPSFDAIVVSFRCVSSGSHMFVFSSHTRPAHSETSPAALTTPVGAENCVVAGQAAFRYSLMSPPQRAVFTTWRCLSGWSAASVATGGR